MSIERIAIASACWLVLGCKSTSGAIDAVQDTELVDAKDCMFGDPAAPLEIELMHFAANQLVRSIPNDEIPLIIPPQGGWAAAFGARVRNLDACSGRLTMAFRDACSTDIIKLDGRTVQLAPTSDGWAIVTFESLSYLQLCPQPTAPRNLHDNPFVFIAAFEAAGKQSQTELPLIPVCPANDQFCPCECDRDYVLGGGCPVTPTDAGVPSC
jgi:hypothetical protein